MSESHDANRTLVYSSLTSWNLNMILFINVCSHEKLQYSFENSKTHFLHMGAHRGSLTADVFTWQEMLLSKRFLVWNNY